MSLLRRTTDRETKSIWKTLVAVDPVHVLISAGIDNQFGHPHEETLEMFDDADAEVYSTHEGDSWVTYVDDDGDLVTEGLRDWLE